jgi:phosphopantetheinyl transferase
MIIRPVVLEVPVLAQGLRGQSRVEDLELRARDAAAMSAMGSGHAVPIFERTAAQRPIPSRGVHWSMASKPSMVASVTSIEPVSIELEQIRPRADYQIAGALDNQELEILGGDATHAYFCAWVAKEAVLKLHGQGLQGLSRAKVTKAWADHAIVALDGVEYPISFAFFSGHVAAVTGRPELVAWTFIPENTPAEITAPDLPSAFV